MTDEDILSCHVPEFIIQNTLLLFIIIVFLYYAFKVTKAINLLISQTRQEAHEQDQSTDFFLDRRSLMLHESRKAAMKKIWILLIWLMVVAIESLLYSILTYYLSGDHC